MDYKEIAVKCKENRIPTIVTLVIAVVVWSMGIGNLLNEPEYAKFGLDGSITYKENMIGCQTFPSVSAEDGISAIWAHYFGSAEADISYRVHVKGKGWSDWASNGAYAGERGSAIIIDGVQLKLNSTENERIEYRVLYQDGEWSEWSADGETSGDIDSESYLRWLEAVVVKE